MFVLLEEKTKYYTKEESDDKNALKSDIVNVVLSKYTSIGQLNDKLTESYGQKKDLSYKLFNSIPVDITGDEMGKADLSNTFSYINIKFKYDNVEHNYEWNIGYSSAMGAWRNETIEVNGNNYKL